MTLTVNLRDGNSLDPQHLQLHKPVIKTPPITQTQQSQSKTSNQRRTQKSEIYILQKEKNPKNWRVNPTNQNWNNTKSKQGKEQYGIRRGIIEQNQRNGSN